MTHSHTLDYPLFSTLTPEESHRLTSVAKERTFRKQDFIYREGDDATYLYIVLKGEVKIGSAGAEGRELIRSVVRPLAVFGQTALSGMTQRDGFSQSLANDTAVLQLPVATVQQLMRQNFGLCQLLLQNLGQQLQTAQNRLTSVVMYDARTRIVEFLKETVKSSGQKVGFEYLIRHCLTHQDIANITCTSRQTVTLVLNELRKANLIYFNRGKILVRDVAALA